PYSFSLLTPTPSTSTLFPYTTLFRSSGKDPWLTRSVTLLLGESNQSLFGDDVITVNGGWHHRLISDGSMVQLPTSPGSPRVAARSEEHTSELQSRVDLVCRLLLEKKK